VEKQKTFADEALDKLGIMTLFKKKTFF